MIIENLKQKAEEAMLDMRINEGYSNALNRAISNALEWITYNSDENGELPDKDSYRYSDIVGTMEFLKTLIDLSERRDVKKK